MQKPGNYCVALLRQKDVYMKILSTVTAQNKWYRIECVNKLAVNVKE